MAGYSDAQMCQGYEQAESFIARIKSGEPITMDELAQQIGLARMGSMERLRGFCSRLQAALLEGVRDA
ncbi:MAG: hypothetical protein ROZ64_15840 [Burkholderiaceae bacterium]|jgi:hypothetical protein|nr:hypothetical protein [Burkholderiaceae bacterium]